MHTIFLDIATHMSSSLDGSSGAVACVDDAVASLIPIDDRMNDSDLLPAVENALKKARWSYDDLTNIACVIGPGGFTSLRMGVSLANALADQLKIPAAGVHLSDLYEARMPSPLPSPASGRGWTEGPGEGFLWIHSTKKTELFVRGFGQYAEQWNEPTLINIDDCVSFVSAQDDTIYCCGELIPDHRQRIPHWQPVPLRPLADVLPAFLAQQIYKIDLLLPWYGRSW